MGAKLVLEQRKVKKALDMVKEVLKFMEEVGARNFNESDFVFLHDRLQIVEDVLAGCRIFGEG